MAEMHILGSRFDQKFRKELNENFGSLSDSVRKSTVAVEKATDAVSKAEEARNQASSVQSQLTQIVVEGDSSVEAAQARVDKDGEVYTTLKQRLDTKDEMYTTQLANIEKFAFGTIGKTLEKLLNGTQVKVVCGGDSNTWGYDPANPGNQLENPYPKLLEYRLRSFYNNANVTVINKAVSGTTSQYTKNNINLVIDENPDLYILMIGANDLKSAENHRPLTEYIDNLKEIIEKVRGAGIEVILMSPPANFAGNNFPEKIHSYVHAMESVAHRYRCFFIDLAGELNRMFSQKIEDPRDVFPDDNHFREGKTHIIADTIMTKATHAKWFSDVIRDNPTIDTSIYLYRSPFVEAVGLTSNRTDQDFFKSFYIQDASAGQTGTYLKAKIFIPTNGVDIILKSIKSTSGGKQFVYVNGEMVRTIDFYSPTIWAYGNETTIIENVNQGYYEIYFPVEGLLGGEYTSTAGPRAFFNELIIRPSKIVPIQTVIVEGTEPMPKAEYFYSLISGQTVYQSFAPNARRSVLFNDKQLELKPNNTTVIEASGKFFGGSGISWFGNKSSQTSAQGGVVLGYVVYMTSVNVFLYRSLGTGVGTEIASSPRVTDFSSDITIRIEHHYNGKITVYIDDEQIIEHDSPNYYSSGYVGLYSYFGGKIKLNRLEYAYI